MGIIIVEFNNVFDTLSLSVCEKKNQWAEKNQSNLLLLQPPVYEFYNTSVYYSVCAIIPDTNFELLYTYIHKREQ